MSKLTPEPETVRILFGFFVIIWFVCVGFFIFDLIFQWTFSLIGK